MKPVLIKELYKLAINSKKNKVSLPSIRSLSNKYNISSNEVIKVFEWYKNLNTIITIHGSQSFLIKDRFLHLFKNDSNIIFGPTIKRNVIKSSIDETESGFIHKFHRTFCSNSGKAVSISFDSIYLHKPYKIDISKGIDEFIRLNFKGNKIVTKETSVIDIENFEEFKILNEKMCIMLETMIFDSNNFLISHSFSLFPVSMYKNYELESFI